MKLLHIITDSGAPFTVRLVETGDTYGLDGCRTHLPDAPGPLVEFYDQRFPDTANGQFVSRYCAVTLMRLARQRDHAGLCLHTGSPEWSVDAEIMTLVRAWLANVVRS